MCCAWIVTAVVGPSADAQFGIDYRFRSLNNGSTSYEFGTSEAPPEGWAPLSRLDFSLDSVWHGLELRLEQPVWEVHVEWLTPVHDGVKGTLYDYDWLPPNPDSSFTDLGVMRERWISGQMLDINLDVKLLDGLLGQPIEVWPLGGFRWQRFHVMCYDLVQREEDNAWPTSPYTYTGDVIDFKQDYYSPYAGVQLRTLLTFWSILPTRLTLQFDAGYVTAHNTDHHLIREGDRYTFDRTGGSSGHIAFLSELLLSEHMSLGLEFAHLTIHTTGTHQLVNAPLDIDETTDHGVRVWSDQSTLTAYFCFRI
jgi:hypothetical protein